MNKKSAFSPEYDIGNATESKSSAQVESSPTQDNTANDFINKIPPNYKLSKPIRKLIRASIIQK